MLTTVQIQQLYLGGYLSEEAARTLIGAALRAEGRVGTGGGQITEDNLDRHIGLLFQPMIDAKNRGEQPTLTSDQINEILGIASTTLGQAAGTAGAADDTLFRDPIISEPSFGQAFSRFMGGTPFAATPGLMSAAAAMRPIAQTQFQLQPSTPVFSAETGELQPRGIGEFSRFLPGAFGGEGGSFLRGGDLSQRLSELTRALFRNRGQGDDPINPRLDPRQAQLFQEFGDPQNTFSAFNLPGLMATQGRGRALLAAAQDRFRNRWLGQNPNATGWDVANQAFGRSANWT